MVAFLFPSLPLVAIIQSTLHPLPTASHVQNTVITTSNRTPYNSDTYSWNLPNGFVQFDTPLQIHMNTRENREELLILSEPTFLGSGGSGAVFAFTNKPNHDDSQSLNKVAIKVSWKASKATVQNECEILQTLESYNVPHVEQCIAQTPYLSDRVMIALTPVVTDRTSSITNLGPMAKQNAVREVVETMVGMLLANVITFDVQPLFSDKGEVLFIDFTEAKHLLSPPDLIGIVGFCNEMITLIPENDREDAAAYLKLLLRDFEKRGVALQREVSDVVESIWFEL